MASQRQRQDNETGSPNQTDAPGARSKDIQREHDMPPQEQKGSPNSDPNPDRKELPGRKANGNAYSDHRNDHEDNPSDPGEASSRESESDEGRHEDAIGSMTQDQDSDASPLTLGQDKAKYQSGKQTHR